MVPNGWDCQPLSKLLEKVIDYRGQSVPKASHGVPLITARNVRDGYLDFTSQEFVSDQDYASWMKRGTPKPGDILFTTEAPLGKACRFPELGRFAVGQRTVTLRTNSRLDSDYLLYFILSTHGQNLIDLRSSGSTAKGIKSSELKKVKVSFPEHLAEQKKIAQILSTWDKAITTTEQLLTNSQQQKKALMQQLLTGPHPSKPRLLDKNGVRFSGEWTSVTVADVCKVGRGRVISKIEIEANPGNYPVYSSQTLNNGVMGYLDTFDFDGEYVTWTTDGVNAGTVFYRAGKFNCTNVCGVLSKKEQPIDLQFLALALSVVAYKYVSHTLANPKLMNGVMSAISIQIPSLAEQQKIAAVLSAADQEITTLQLQLNHLKQEKKALMQQLLTGKRRVKIDGVIHA